MSYREAVAAHRGEVTRAGDLNRLLATERSHRGHGLVRAGDRRTWTAQAHDLPDGVVVVTDRPRLVRDAHLFAFSFDGWCDPVPRPSTELTVLTPRTSVAALAHGFVPEMSMIAAIGT